MWDVALQVATVGGLLLTFGGACAAAVGAQYRCFLSAEPAVTEFPGERNDKTNDCKRDLTLSRGR